MLATLQVISTGIAILIVDKFGRKILLVFSDAAMSVSIIALGIYFYLDENRECLYKEENSSAYSNYTTEESLTDLTTIESIIEAENQCVPNTGKFDNNLVDSLDWLPLVRNITEWVFSTP